MALQDWPIRGFATGECAFQPCFDARTVKVPLDRQVFHAAVVDAIGTFLGADAKKGFDMAFSLNTIGELRRLASDAGLSNCKIRFEHRTMRHPSASEMTLGFMQSTLVAGQFGALPEQKQNAFVEHVSKLLEDYVDDAGLASPLENHFLTANR